MSGKRVYQACGLLPSARHSDGSLANAERYTVQFLSNGHIGIAFARVRLLSECAGMVVSTRDDSGQLQL
jgi:hypothetical protein